MKKNGCTVKTLDSGSGPSYVLTVDGAPCRLRDILDSDMSQAILNRILDKDLLRLELRFYDPTHEINWKTTMRIINYNDGGVLFQSIEGVRSIDSNEYVSISSDMFLCPNSQDYIHSGLAFLLDWTIRMLIPEDIRDSMKKISNSSQPYFVGN